MIFRTLSDRTTSERPVSMAPQPRILEQTFILPDVLERESQPGVFALDDPDFSKSTLAHDSEQSKVIEIH